MSLSAEKETTLLKLAMAKPAAERLAFLKSECEEDQDLFHRLETVVAGAESAVSDAETVQANAGTMLLNFSDLEGTLRVNPEAGPPTVLLDLAHEPTDSTIGKFIGRYKLVEKLGEGGCGSVYVAEQTEPVRRRVALKVIKLGMDTEQVVSRFEAERQALAMMDHPNIAKALDAGATETGRPYFVMELVRGIKLTDYCNQAKLSIKGRLDLFIQVCKAIQHAHQKGIIHRDIKPSNILVSLPDGVPVPKVIDFGIAKATADRLTDSPVYTQLHTFMGTPAYMSPEQAEMSGLDIDTRSDIYSLGVALYELLTDLTPFDAHELAKSGIDGIRKTIREQEALRPSAKLATLAGEELTATAKRRSLEASRLVHAVRGDLDWIVMKCLEKDRARRYETANGLANDIQRYLNCEPVLARPPSRVYEFQKTVRRHKFGFAATAAIILVMAGGIALTAWQAEVARGAAKRALSQQARADQVAGFLKDMLKTVGPSVARGRDTALLREILTNTTARLDKEFSDRPDVEADLRFTIGRAYRDLEEYPAAIAMQRRVLELRRKVFGDRSDAVAETLMEMAVDYGYQGDWAHAEQLQREALSIRRETLDPNSPIMADTYNNLGLILQYEGKLRQASDALHTALAIKQKILKPPNEKLADAQLNLSLLDYRLGDYVEGDQQARIALKAYRELFGEKLPSDKIGMALHNMAKNLREEGKLDEAERAVRDAMAVYNRLYPDGHSFQVEALEDLGLTLQKKGDARGAEAAFRDGIAMGTKVLGKDHPQTLRHMRCLAVVLGANPAGGAEADELMQQAMKSARATLAKQPAVLAMCLLDQADYLIEIKKRLQDAEPVLLEAYGLLNSSVTASAHVKKVCHELEVLYGKLNRPDDARKWAAKAAELAGA